MPNIDVRKCLKLTDEVARVATETRLTGMDLFFCLTKMLSSFIVRTDADMEEIFKAVRAEVREMKGVTIYNHKGD
jgi:hypothetical protein